MTALELEGVGRQFGGLRAVDDVSLALARGARHGLIGPNGAGKSTLFKLITGTLPPTDGTVRFGGRDVSGVSEHGRAGLGMAQTFQHSSLFMSLTCRDNVLLAMQRVEGRAHRIVPPRPATLKRAADDALEAAGLGARGGRRVAALSHGERRQLEVCVAVACRPSLLLLDEPAAGMSPAETSHLTGMLESLPADLTVLLIEHDLDFVFRVAEDVTVLHLGSVLESGPAGQIRESEQVQRVYLGLEAGEQLFFDDDAAPSRAGGADGAA